MYIPENHRSTVTDGIAMYVNQNFEVQIGEDLRTWEEKVYESLFLGIKADAFSFVCGVIYKTQSSSIEIFREKLNNSLTRIAQESQVKQYAAILIKIFYARKSHHQTKFQPYAAILI